MQLHNEFEVLLSPTEAWDLLTNLEKVAPCLPGASITSVDGDEYHGRAKIKVGPITSEYKGVASFTTLDPESHTAVISARGKDVRGQGNVTATVTATLTAENAGTRVMVDTDLALTGKVAQFGRGALVEVSAALMSLFAERLQEMVASEGTSAPPAPSVSGSDSQPPDGVTSVSANHALAPEPRRVSDRNDDEVLDILALAGGLTWSKALPTGSALVSVLAAVVSVVAAGYAAARARSAGRRVR